jgi:hypothetical protein
VVESELVPKEFTQQRDDAGVVHQIAERPVPEEEIVLDALAADGVTR